MASESTHTPPPPVFLDSSKQRKWYFRSGTIACAVFLLVMLAVFAFGLMLFARSHPPVTYQDAIEHYHYYNSGANNKKVALTFDDGPNSPASETIMSALKQGGVPATFFYIGKRAFIRPDLVKAAVEAGFDVEDHSFTHAENFGSSYNRVALELDATGFLLGQITGTTPHYFRSPFLEDIGIDPTVNPYIPLPEQEQWEMQAGYLPVGSDLDTKDWLASTPQGVLDGLKQALARNPNGHIVLMHDDPTTAKAVPAVVAYLRGQGYDIVPLAELLEPPQEVALTMPLASGDTDVTTNGEVSKLQWFLYEQRYLDAYALSGSFDADTRAAVVNFQADYHLADPANPSSGTGVVGPATRALIHELAPAPAAADFPTLGRWNVALVPLHAVVMAVYINLFPVVRNVLIVMVLVTLGLVVLRSLGLVALLTYRWLNHGLNGAAAHDAQPALSVIIPAYNEEENIAATVESVLQSTYRRREVIVVDDGSTDATAKEVRGVIARYPQEHVRLITVENGGKACALNTGVELAHSGIVVVLDADAVLDPDALSHMVPHFADPEVGAVAGKVCTTGSRTFLDIFQKLEYAIGQNIDKTAFSTIGAVGVVPGPAGAWRRSTLREVGGFHLDTLVEDQEMTLTMLHRGNKVIYEPRAIAYTETPSTMHDFLKQRFRWVYGTMQCFWKHRSVYKERPLSAMCLVVLPNVFIYNILLPLTYPFADSAFVFGIIFGEWRSLVLPFFIFTGVDLAYALWGLRGEQDKWKLLAAVPLQRIVYRQLLYYTVYKGFIRAMEGTGTRWNKFRKLGETRRFYFSAMATQSSEIARPLQLPQLSPDDVGTSFHGPSGTSASSTNRHEVMSLSVIPKHLHSAGETSNPALAPNVFVGRVEDPNTYAKSSSPFGPTSSH